MATPEVEAGYNQIVKTVSRTLKSLGFKKRGTCFRRTDCGNVGLIEFQRSRDSDAQSLKFTINIGIVSGELLRRWDPERDIGKETVWTAHLRERLGAFLSPSSDHWWVISEDSRAPQVEDEVLHLLVAHALPFLERHMSDADLLALWNSGRSPGLTEPQRMRNVAQLQEALQAAG